MKRPALKLVSGASSGKGDVPDTDRPRLSDDVIVAVAARLLRRGYPPRAVVAWWEQQ